MFPTRHAIQRYQERVAAVTTAEAARRIRAHASGSTVLRRPRPWTPASAAPGITFLYPPDLPGVCFLVRDGAVLTVFERSTVRSWVRAAEVSQGKRSRRIEPYHRPSPGSLVREAA